MPLKEGQVIDNKYKITGLIGEGGMGAVYEGENIRIRRRVAIKVLHSAFTSNVEAKQRFEHEAQAAGHIGNDHILEVLDLGTLPDGDSFMVMEYLDGEPLPARIKRETKLTAQEVAPIATQVLTGLAAAHDAGIIHRDLKPDNIFILKEKAGRKDFVKIIDFGISKFSAMGGEGLKMTRTGTVMGTPYYMSPETASGSPNVDHRSDIYSVGVILFEAVTGRVPFEGGTFNQLMFKIVLSDVPTPLSIAPDLDPAFASIISKAMARNADQRFQSCSEFKQAIEQWMQSGSAVSVPPDDAPSARIPDEVRAPMASMSDQDARATLAKHAGDDAAADSESWAHTQFKVPRKKNRALVATIAAIVLSGAGFAAYATLKPGTKAAPAPAAEMARPAAKPKPPPAAEAEPRVEPAEEPQKADIDLDADEAQADAGTAESKSEPASNSGAAEAQTAAKKKAAPSPATLKRWKAARQSAKKKKKTTSFDFGY